MTTFGIPIFDFTSSKTDLITEGSEKSALMARSAAFEISSLGFRDTAIVLYPFSEKYLAVATPVLGPAPRMRAIFEAMTCISSLPVGMSGEIK